MDNQTLMFIIAAIGTVGGIVARDRSLLTMIQSAKEECYKLFVLKDDYHREQAEIKEALTSLRKEINNVNINCSRILTILEKNNNDGHKT